jgi:hydrogenase-4 membrane subunit HyfE
MTYLLITFLVVLLVPLFAATWRTSLLGLSLQGLLLGWIALRDETAPSWHSLLVLVDLPIVRGLLVPAYFYRVLKRRKAPARSDVIAPNFFSWTLAGMLVFGAFRFAAAVVPAAALDSTQVVTHVAVASSALALGLFVLGSRNTVVSQAIGVLRIENAVTLFELADTPRLSLPIHLVVTIVFLAVMLTLGRFFSLLAYSSLGRNKQRSGIAK